MILAITHSFFKDINYLPTVFQVLMQVYSSKYTIRFQREKWTLI